MAKADRFGFFSLEWLFTVLHGLVMCFFLFFVSLQAEAVGPERSSKYSEGDSPVVGLNQLRLGPLPHNRPHRAQTGPPNAAGTIESGGLQI